MERLPDPVDPDAARAARRRARLPVRRRRRARSVDALAATLIDLALGIVLWANFDIGGPQWQFVERAPLFAGSTGRSASTASR
jgi:hypothetical protein